MIYPYDENTIYWHTAKPFQLTKGNWGFTEKSYFYATNEYSATAAEQQLKKYVSDEKLNKILEQTKLIKLILIFSGHELIYIDEIAF